MADLAKSKDVHSLLIELAEECDVLAAKAQNAIDTERSVRINILPKDITIAVEDRPSEHPDRTFLILCHLVLAAYWIVVMLIGYFWLRANIGP